MAGDCVVAFVARNVAPASDKARSLEFTNGGTLKKVTDGEMCDFIQFDINVGQIELCPINSDLVW